MKLIRVDYPLHVIQEVLGTLAGRIVVFFATYLAAYLAVLLVSVLTGLVWDSLLHADTIVISILWGLGLAGYLALRRRDASPLLGS